jgi:uncharacterized membrane protein YgcG
LIAAYRTLGGSFTGSLAVDPAHLRDLRQARAAEVSDTVPGVDLSPEELGSDRSRRIRDAVQAALSDILLLGTDEHVRLAQRAARELVEGRHVHTHELVVSLRDYVRRALQLEPIPTDVAASIPVQGPTRPAGSGGGKGRERGGEGGRGGARGGAGGMGGGMAVGGIGVAAGAGIADDPVAPSEQRSEPG